MAYELIYRGQWKNFEGETCILHISDTTSGSVNPPAYQELTMMSVEMRVISDEEEKGGVKGVRVIFSFLSTATHNLMTFAEGTDERYLVELFIGNTSNSIFTGYLVLDAAKDKYLPDNTYGVELTASDNLGILKELPLTDFDGDIPKGKYKIIEFIAWCLAKTNLQLSIKAAYNLFEQNYNGASHDPFSTIYVEAMTFETEVNGRENCYTVLQKILSSFGCFMTQYAGAWWIIRVDEMNASAYRVYSYTYLGVFTGASALTMGKSIGSNLAIKLIRRDAEILPERKNKYVKQTYPFTYPQEIICNTDFSRGTLLPLSVPGGAAYTVECWTPGRFGVAAVASPYIRRLFTNGYETERVLVFPVSAVGGSTQHYVQSEDIPLNVGDKFNFSVDSRFSADVTGSSGTYRDLVVQIRLYGSDGTRWFLTNQPVTNEQPGDWIQTNSSFSTNQRQIQHVWNVTQEDESKWFNLSVEAKPVPRGGFIRVFLLQSGLFGSIRETHYANLSFEYIPINNGIYQKLTGQYHKVSIPESLRANVEEEVALSDTHNDLFKGALFRYNGSDHVRVGNFYNYLAGTSGELGLERFGKYQAFALWNQHNRVMRKFTGSLLGLDTSTPLNMPGLLHRYQFTGGSDHTDNKYYALLSYSQNLVSCQWSGTFMDVFDTVEGKSYDDTHEFKYTMQ